MDEGDFGGAGDEVEHGFAEEGGAEADAVEASGELAVAPDFEGMGVAEVVEGEVAADDGFVDPGILPLGAVAHDGFEGGIQPDLPGGVFEGFFGAVGDVEGIQGDDAAGVGGEAADGAIFHGHGEPAGGVKAQKLVRRNQGCHWKTFSYYPAVQRVTLLFGLLALALISGCSFADTSADDVSQKFQRGMQGQGTIVPHDPLDDSFGNDYR